MLHYNINRNLSHTANENYYINAISTSETKNSPRKDLKGKNRLKRSYFFLEEINHIKQVNQQI